MPRKPRIIQGNHIYHVLNRSVARITLFRKPQDYGAFLTTLHQAHEKFPVPILAYILMPNHFHLLLRPKTGREHLLSQFMQWLQLTHTQRWHAHHNTAGTGHLYQGRFKSFPVQGDFHFRTVARYVEQNALRANLCKKAELWPHSSLHLRLHGTPDQQKLLSPWPEGAAPTGARWLDLVNTIPQPAIVAALQKSLTRGTPFGAPDWIAKTAKSQNLEHTTNPRGRPRKSPASK